MKKLHIKYKLTNPSFSDAQKFTSSRAGSGLPSFSVDIDGRRWEWDAGDDVASGAGGARGSVTVESGAVGGMGLCVVLCLSRSLPTVCVPQSSV